MSVGLYKNTKVTFKIRWAAIALQNDERSPCLMDGVKMAERTQFYERLLLEDSCLDVSVKKEAVIESWDLYHKMVL